MPAKVRYENNVLTPLEELDLKEGEEVEIEIIKSNADRIRENTEISSMVTAFGFEMVNNKVNVDLSKLRYGKIAICTDADSDGYHIGLLIMAALQYVAQNRKFVRF